MKIRNKELGMRNNKKAGCHLPLLMPALLVLAVCFLLFVLGCSNVFDLPKTQNPVSDGEGYFSLHIGGGGSGGRTIMPQTVLEADLFDGGIRLFSAPQVLILLPLSGIIVT